MPSWNRYLSQKDGEGIYEMMDFKVHRLAAYFPSQKAIFKSPKKLADTIEKEDFDILHLYGLGTFSTLMVLYFSLKRKKRFPAIVVSDHTDARTHKREGVHAKFYYFFFGLTLSIFQKQIKKVITFADQSRDLLSKRFSFNKDKFEVIPLGYDQDAYKFKEKLKNTEDKFIIGYAGKIDEKKKVHDLIKAMAKTQCRDEVRLIVVGFTEDNYGKYLVNLARENNIEVEFRPLANQKQLMEFYNYINLAVFPGGISITTIEANGCGTPVLIYKSIQGLESRVENGRGVLFDTEKELVENIENYYSLYTKGEIDYHCIEQETKNSSSWKNIIGSYLKLYIQVNKNGK